MQNDEAELIDQSMKGDHHAYAELIERYKHALYHHCFAIIRDEDAAEDIAQETFISAFYNLDRYNSKYRLGTWLFKISTNKCLDHLRRKSRQIANADEIIAQIASTRPGPETEATNDELHLAVEKLRPQYRAAISLYYWHGLGYAETALIMGAPINSVRVWLKRAKEELRKELS